MGRQGWQFPLRFLHLTSPVRHCSDQPGLKQLSLSCLHRLLPCPWTLGWLCTCQSCPCSSRVHGGCCWPHCVGLDPPGRWASSERYPCLPCRQERLSTSPLPQAGLVQPDKLEDRSTETHPQEGVSGYITAREGAYALAAYRLQSGSSRKAPCSAERKSGGGAAVHVHVHAHVTSHNIPIGGGFLCPEQSSPSIWHPTRSCGHVGYTIWPGLLVIKILLLGIVFLLFFPQCIFEPCPWGDDDDVTCTLTPMAQLLSFSQRFLKQKPLFLLSCGNHNWIVSKL